MTAGLNVLGLRQFFRGNAPQLRRTARQASSALRG